MGGATQQPGEVTLSVKTVAMLVVAIVTALGGGAAYVHQETRTAAPPVDRKEFETLSGRVYATEQTLAVLGTAQTEARRTAEARDRKLDSINTQIGEIRETLAVLLHEMRRGQPR